MPQLDSLTYIAGLFWFIFIYIGFYLLSINIVIPAIYKNRILRLFIISKSSKILKNKKSYKSSLEVIEIDNIKNNEEEYNKIKKNFNGADHKYINYITSKILEKNKINNI